MRYVMKINNGYVKLQTKEIAGKPTPTINVGPIRQATVCSEEQIQAIGQEVYHYAKEIHNTLVEVIIVL